MAWILASCLHTDAIDLRILNLAPVVLQYRVLRDGVLLFSRDEPLRSEFEAEVMMRFFQLKPYLEEHMEMLESRIRGGK